MLSQLQALEQQRVQNELIRESAHIHAAVELLREWGSIPMQRARAVARVSLEDIQKTGVIPAPDVLRRMIADKNPIAWPTHVGRSDGGTLCNIQVGDAEAILTIEGFWERTFLLVSAKAVANELLVDFLGGAWQDWRAIFDNGITAGWTGNAEKARQRESSMQARLDEVFSAANPKDPIEIQDGPGRTPVTPVAGRSPP